MNEIVRFTDDLGRSVEITPQDVKRHLCAGATDSEIALFLELCKAQRLNPFIKDAYLVKYGNAPASIITGKEVFTKRANANPNFEGMEYGVVFMRKTAGGVTVEKREGAAVYKAAGETLLGGWARVFVKGKRPFYSELALEEYSTGKSNWAKMPAVMICKCCQVSALRSAFPDQFQNLYSAEEMGKAGEVVLQEDNAPKPVSADQPMMNDEPLQVHFVEMMNESQERDLGELIGQFAEMRGKSFDDVNDAIFASETMKAAGAIAGEMLTFEQAALAIRLVENWVAKAQAARIEQGFDEQHESPLAAAQAAARAAISSSELADEDILF